MSYACFGLMLTRTSIPPGPILLCPRTKFTLGEAGHLKAYGRTGFSGLCRLKSLRQRDRGGIRVVDGYAGATTSRGLGRPGQVGVDTTASAPVEQPMGGIVNFTSKTPNPYRDSRWRPRMVSHS